MQEKDIVDYLIQYIELNLEHKNRVNDLVEDIGYCRRGMQYFFKKHTGMTMKKYINGRRISRAAVMLKLTDISIIDISIRLTYDSQQTFTREFKKFFGVTPRQYRVLPEWRLENLISKYKGLNEIVLPPRLCKLKKRILTGSVFCCDTLLYPELNNSKRFKKILEMLSGNKNKIITSNKLGTVHEKNAGKVKTIIWSGEKDKNISIYHEGYHAHFSFVFKTESEYINHIRRIYYYYASVYRLTKSNNFDIEIIKNYNNIFRCHYFLPVIYQ